jgi:hypothetical protein
MTDAVWQKYVADFMVQVRDALPGIEIVHNALWPVPDTLPDVARELNAADYIELERGFNDSGITGGSTYWGFQKLANFIDHRHAAGKGVILDGYADTSAGRLYGLATYFLLNNGRDALANDAYGTPDNWWNGYETDLGAPAGPRYLSGGVWRRDFAKGTVLVNEPGPASRTVTVGSGFRDLTGAARDSVTLAPASGAVLVRDQVPTDTTVGTTPTPTPTPPVATPTPTPVPTPVPVATPVATPTPRPVSTPSPRKPARRPRATAAGAAAPSKTATTARATRVNVHGKVRGATGGTVRITIEKRRGGGWTRARRARATVQRSGEYSRDVARLARGSYRVQARYLGTGTALPSRSAYHRFSLRP